MLNDYVKASLRHLGLEHCKVMVSAASSYNWNEASSFGRHSLDLVADRLHSGSNLPEPRRPFKSYVSSQSPKCRPREALACTFCCQLQ